jgi:hypothetical protein
MKNKLLKLAGVGVAVVAFGMTAQAIPIVNGIIQFGGTATLNHALPNATAFSSFTHVATTYGTQTGDYAGLDGLHVTMPGFTFLPSLSPDPITQWSFTVGLITYSFDLYSPLVVSEDSHSLDITGNGIANITGETSAAGSWELTTQGHTTVLSFSAYTTVPGVPDGGMTVMLLGAALSAMGLLRKKLVA